MTAPCNPRRECLGCPYADKLPGAPIIAFGGALQVDLTRWVLTLNGTEIRVQPMVALIAGALASQPHTVVPYDRIMLAMDRSPRVRKPDNMAELRSRDVLLVRLRKVLAKYAPGIVIRAAYAQGLYITFAQPAQPLPAVAAE